MAAENTILSPVDSKPGILPALGVWRSEDGQQTLVSSTFPEPAGFTCDTWCYENDSIDFSSAQAMEEGKIQMRHTWRDHAETLITVVTPRPESVEFVAYLEDAGSHKPIAAKEYPAPNACWQLRHAPMFASKPDPYPEFVKRCFIFTDRGLTFLDRTERFNVPPYPPDHRYNNPPWVQMYLPVWERLRQAGPDSWAAYSTDRFIYPVIGAVSRDGRYLAATATEATTMMCQAWHDCMHHSPQWLPTEGGTHKTWRMAIYVLRNDPAELLRRVAADFPGAMTLKDKRVPA